MKKIISILLVAVMLVGFIPMAVRAEDESTVCDHTYGESSTFEKNGDGEFDFVFEKEPETGTAVDNCHYCYCENCRRWILMECDCDGCSSDKVCTEHDACDICGESFVNHTSLEWVGQKNENNCYWRCKACKAEGELQDHYYGVECGEYCVKCGHQRTDADHSFEQKSNDEYHWQECSVCGKISDKAKHYGGKATCTALAVCEECGKKYGSYEEHTPGKYVADENGHWQVCENCGQKVYEANPHTYNAWHKSSTAGLLTRECTVCGYEDDPKPIVGNTYTVEFDNNGHGATVSDQIVYDGNCVEDPGTLKETGWTFKGWYSDELLTKEYIFTDEVHSNMTLYAKWVEAEYNITYKEVDTEGNIKTFDGQHEAGYPTTHAYGYDTELNEAEEDGYEFYGWYEDAEDAMDLTIDEDTGEIAEEGRIETLGATDYTDDITLYAKLKGHEYTVDYLANTDDATLTGEMEYDQDDVFTYGTAKALKKNAFERTGYRFTKWTKNQDGSGTSYKDQQKVTDLTTIDGGVVELYANWEAEKYAIEYFDEGGEEFSGNATGCPTVHTYGKDTELKTPKRPGYEFKGWYEDPECTIRISSIGKYEITDDIRIYAKWEAKENYITYYANGEGVSGKMADQTFISGEEVTLNALGYKKTGFKFLGWAESEDGAVVYTDGQAGLVFEQDDPVELYAKWGEIFKVRLVTNGGKIAEGKDVTEYVQGVGAALPDKTEITKDGLVLAGWYEKSDFSDDPVSVISAKESGDKVYYAKWEIKTYSLSFYLASSYSTSTGTASFTVDGGTATSITSSGIVVTNFNGSEVVKVTATPGTSYYAKIYTESKTLATSSKGTSITYQLPESVIKSNPTIKIAFSTNPFTGDDFDPMLWIIALGAAGAGAAITIFAKKKAHN